VREGVLACRNGASDSLELAGRVVDPTLGIDESLSVTVEDGVITRLEPASPGPLVIVPAFVDPHVHLRTPGREDEETIASGTEAAAAGGYCAILAMPNTDPVVDSAAVLGSLIDRAREEAVVPTGFMAAISKGQRGTELSEMVELAEAGAAAFTDDGRPVESAALMRRALQYSALADRPLALHCEDPALSRGGQVHEGVVSAELGLGAYPSLAESVMVARDLALASYEDRPLHVMHISAAESVDALRASQAAGVRATGEATPHHLVLTDEAVRSLDPNTKMNPPLRAEDDRRALIDALRDGTIGAIATDHAPHSLEEKDVPFEEAPFGVTGLETAFAALHTHLVLPGLIPLETLLERMSAGPARALGLPQPRIEVGARANLAVLDLVAEWQVKADGFHSRSTNSWLLGETLTGRVVSTIADGREVFASGVVSTEPPSRRSLDGAGL
jgi:dihydroorotase